MEQSKLKLLNKETVTWAIMEHFYFSGQLVDEIVETIWNSDKLLAGFQNDSQISRQQWMDYWSAS